jgi:hypothetical protein
MFAIVRLLGGLGGEGRGKENDRILKHIASGYEDGLTKHS